MVVSRNGDIEENRWNGQKTEKKNDFPYFDMLGHQKHPYVGRILKKSLQGSIHSQFYMSIKGPFGQFVLQPCTVSVKGCKNKFPTRIRCDILIKASTDRRVWKQARIALVAQVFVAYSRKCDCKHWRIYKIRCSHACRNQQAFWHASANGHRCPQECKVKRRSI